MRRATLAAAAVLAVLAAAPGAFAAEYEWNEGNDIVTSPDGRNVYAAGATTLSFRADPEGGALTLIGHTEPGADRPQMAISPDGRHVYVGRGRNYPSGAILVMSRDAESGLLTHEETFTGADPGTAAVGPVADLEMSVDGRQLYVAESNPDLVAVYERNVETGALTQRQVLYRGADLPVAYALDLAGSPDGRHIYVAGSNLAILRRDPTTGLLSAAGTAQDNGSDFAVAVSADGGRVYGGMTNVDSWRRDPEGGALEHIGHGEFVAQSCGACDSGRMIVASPDGRVYSSSPPDSALLEARPADDGLVLERRYVDGQDGVRGLGHPNAMAWSANGRFAYVASARYIGSGGSYYSSSGNEGAVAAFRRTGAGLDVVGAHGPGLQVDEAPQKSYRPPAVTINDGALYTNDPNVEVTVSNDPGAASLRLSNTGDFAAAPALRIATAEQTFPWRLADGGSERSVRHVHVRFTPLRREEVRISDDIILDQRPPELITARIRGTRLLLKARDNRSGVKRVQVTTSRKRPGKARKFKG
ncbi:MAG TPA: beta-propeller fold lactonase family protein, partial [Thermoleophilaceae bacterium]